MQNITQSCKAKHLVKYLYEHRSRTRLVVRWWRS